jgi:pimeloyl-ACP methyl ester carboxylesterase
MMVLARLARRTYAVAVDLPGHGPSPAGVGAGGASALGIAPYRDAAGLVAGTLCLGPSVVVGHSMGALVAVEAALAWPDKVSALVLCGAGPRLPVSDELMRLIREDYARLPAWLAEHGLSPAARPAVRRGFVAAGVVTPRDTTLADYEALRGAGADVGARLADLRCPVVWIDGADDRIVPPAAGRPGEVRTLPGVGHLIPIEAPGAVAQIVTELLRPDPVEGRMMARG